MNRKALVLGPNRRAQTRILHDFKDIQREPSQYFTAAPLDQNLFTWHFTIRGPQGSAYDGGKYHGMLILPTNFPFSPPDFIFLTPNGRYEVNAKICLSITSFHSESWNSTWTIRKMIEAVAMFMITPSMGAIGAMDLPPSQCSQLAKESPNWVCPNCQKSNETLLPGEFDQDAEQAYLTKCRLGSATGGAVTQTSAVSTKNMVSVDPTQSTTASQMIESELPQMESPKE